MLPGYSITRHIFNNTIFFRCLRGLTDVNGAGHIQAGGCNLGAFMLQTRVSHASGFLINVWTENSRVASVSAA